MSEPGRMVDEPRSTLEQALLHEGRAFRDTEAMRAHTLAALGLATSAGLSTSLLAWWIAKTWTTKLIVVMSAVTLLAAIPVSYLVLGKQSPVVPPAPAVAPPPAPAPRVAPLVLPEPVAPRAPAAVAPQPAPPRAPAPVAAPAVASRTPTNSSSALRAELAALDAVRSTLANDDASGALSFLDAYFRTFPRGRLRPEAEVLRIDALAKAGRVEVARRYAREFLKRHPNSVLTARVQPYADR